MLPERIVVPEPLLVMPRAPLTTPAIVSREPGATSMAAAEPSDTGRPIAWEPAATVTLAADVPTLSRASDPPDTPVRA